MNSITLVYLTGVYYAERGLCLRTKEDGVKMQSLESNTEYYDACFTTCDLSERVLTQAHFEDCEFTHVNFTSARFSACKFINCVFTHCNLSLVDPSGTRFFGVHFNDCKLTGMDWTKAWWPDFYLDHELHFSTCILTSGSFFGLRLHGVKMEGCKLIEVDFRECDLTGATLTECDMTGSLFHHTVLRGADLTESWHYAINIFNNTVEKARFSRLEAVCLLESLGIELVD